jgi:hypothetical protein
MKINFQCPACGHHERIGVLALGWKKLKHQCTNCQNISVQDYKALRATGLLLIGWLACWGVALTGYVAFELSSDLTLIICFALALCLFFALREKVVDVCSSWRLLGTEAAKSEKND